MKNISGNMGANVPMPSVVDKPLTVKQATRLAQAVFDAEKNLRGELKRVARMEKLGLKHKDRRPMYTHKLTGAHNAFGFALFQQIRDRVDTVKMFGDLLNEHAKDPKQVVPEVIKILKEARVITS